MKILIIKLGYSETFDKKIGRISSLGDVLRTTVILHKFRDDDVTWVTDDRAVPLLIENPYIRRILIWDVATSIQLQHEIFDCIINLEKVPGICAMAAQIKARLRYGFTFDYVNGEAVPHSGCEKVFPICTQDEMKKRHGRLWQELLYEVIGAEWGKEEYILGYKPKSREIYEVGLNKQVGNKWPEKAWNEYNWYDLRGWLIRNKIGYCEQPKETDLYNYIDWISSCRLIVTNDSLGFHIALALRKKVIVLVGPTNIDEMYLYDRGIALRVSDNINDITVEMVKEALGKL